MAGLFGWRPGHWWTAAEGATVTWQGRRTSVEAGFSRQVSDGAGLYSAVTLQSANGRLRHQLGRAQELNLGFTYAVNDSIESGHGLRGFSGRIEFQQRLGRSLIFLVAYDRRQQELRSGQGAPSANSAWVTISYNFWHVLGR